MSYNLKWGSTNIANEMHHLNYLKVIYVLYLNEMHHLY
jgi:hypothetical protein